MDLTKIYVFTDEKELIKQYRQLDYDRRVELAERASVLLYQQEQEQAERRRRAEKEMKAV